MLLIAAWYDTQDSLPTLISTSIAVHWIKIIMVPIAATVLSMGTYIDSKKSVYFELPLALISMIAPLYPARTIVSLAIVKYPMNYVIGLSVLLNIVIKRLNSK